MEAARPTHTVDTSGRMCRIVSKTAIPAQLSLLSQNSPLPNAPFLSIPHTDQHDVKTGRSSAVRTA